MMRQLEKTTSMIMQIELQHEAHKETQNTYKVKIKTRSLKMMLILSSWSWLMIVGSSHHFQHFPLLLLLSLFFWSLSFLCMYYISPICAICQSQCPSVSPVMPHMAFVKTGEITEDFYLSDPGVPSIFIPQLDLSHKCYFIVGRHPTFGLLLHSSP